MGVFIMKNNIIRNYALLLLASVLAISLWAAPEMTTQVAAPNSESEMVMRVGAEKNAKDMQTQDHEHRRGNRSQSDSDKKDRSDSGAGSGRRGGRRGDSQAQLGIQGDDNSELNALPEPQEKDDTIPKDEEGDGNMLDGASNKDRVWVDLLEGYRTFKREYPPHSRLMRELAQGQSPQIMVVGCADSRVDPALLFQAPLGKFFIERNIANIVPAYANNNCQHGVGAALEYGIGEKFLNVSHLILLGHSKCGGIKGLLTGIQGDTFITNWIGQVKGAIPAGYVPQEKVTDKEVDTCAQAALKISYKNCMGYPFIEDKVRKGKLVIHVWFFDIEAGKIFMLAKDKEGQPWQPLDDEVLSRFLSNKRAAKK